MGDHEQSTCTSSVATAKANTDGDLRIHRTCPAEHMVYCSMRIGCVLPAISPLDCFS